MMRKREEGKGMRVGDLEKGEGGAYCQRDIFVRGVSRRREVEWTRLRGMGIPLLRNRTLGEL
jgi:hypothetical protein